MRNRVRWEDLDPATFEDMCAVLVSRLFTTVRRIDGVGGDGGRDVMVTTSQGPIIFEMKSFTGRMTPTRRKQVIRSIEKAATHRPHAWNLVVPIDPTPSENHWFDQLSAQYRFPTNWYGRTWLDDQMARMPDIARYFLSRSSDEVLEALRDLSAEQAALGRGAFDAMDRMQVLSNRLNELDPYYAYGLATDTEGNHSVSVWPKYPGAEFDRPSRLTAYFDFPRTKQGRTAERVLQNAFDFGRPAVIDSQFVKRVELEGPIGLLGGFDVGEVQLGPATPLVAAEMSGYLRILGEGGRTVSQVPLKGGLANRGSRGGDIELTDPAGALKVVLTLDFERRGFHGRFDFRVPPNCLPSSILPAARFISMFHSPHMVLIILGERELAPPIPIEHAASEDAPRYLALLEALDEIQRKTGAYFSIPKTFTPQELHDVAMARRLLAGEALRSKWTSLVVTSTVAAIPSLVEALQRGPGPIALEAELTLKLGDAEIPLGFSKQVLPTVIVPEWPAVHGADPGEPVDITFRPGTDDTATTVLIDRVASHEGIRTLGSRMSIAGRA